MLNVGVVGTFATGWLLDRLDGFAQSHPHVDLRISINNNRVDLAGEALDFAIRFGDGAWHGTWAEPLLAAPLTPLCSPSLSRRLSCPADLAGETLLRSYRADEWIRWFEAAGIAAPILRGPVFDSAALMGITAAAGRGIAMAPSAMFDRELIEERLVRPFPIEVDAGRYWLTRLLSRKERPAMRSFHAWISSEIDNLSG